MGMEESKLHFKAFISGIDDERLEEYQGILSECIMGKGSTEVERIIMLGRIVQVKAEMKRRDLL